jgi:Flp pilus assembly protein TadB
MGPGDVGLMGATFLAILLGLCLGLGLTLLYAGLRGVPPRRRLRLPNVDQVVLRIVGAVTIGALLGLATGWPVLALSGAAGGWLLPGMATRRGVQRRRMERGVALIEFVELVADLLEGSGQGVESVLKAAAEVAPRAIRDDSLVLSRELGGRLSLAEALADFAQAMDDPICDGMITALGLGESEQLTRVLRSVAAAGRTEMELRRRIEAGRSGLLWTGRLIVGLTALVALAMVLVDHTYVAPYGSPAGQVLLLVVIGILALSLWAMDRTARITPPRRLPAPVEGER